MDLNTDLPGPSSVVGHGTGRLCCDPALGFADRSGGQGASVATTSVRYDNLQQQLFPDLPLITAKVSSNAFGWNPAGDRGPGNVFENAASSTDLAAGERDRFLDGCLKIQEDERLRLGRELHDSTGQLLLALRLNVAQLKRMHGSPGEDELLDEIEGTASQIDREIRAFAFLHYPAEVGGCGLCDSLAALARGLAARTGLRIRFDRHCEYVDNGPASTALLRVAQEALLNVHRHAHAIHVSVSLTLRDKLLELVVRDDGIGIPPADEIAKSHGVGLLGMRHRMERLGGHFAIKRMKHGTKLVASLPVA